MNKTDQTKSIDQANDLKKLINEVNDKQSSNLQKVDDDQMPIIDVLNLPPRNEVHENNNSRMHLAITKPFLRFSLVVLFIAGFIITLFYFGEIDFFDLFK